MIRHTAYISSYFVQTNSAVFTCQDCGKIFVTNGKSLVVIQYGTPNPKTGKFIEEQVEHEFTIPITSEGEDENKMALAGIEFLGKIVNTISIMSFEKYMEPFKKFLDSLSNGGDDAD